MTARRSITTSIGPTDRLSIGLLYWVRWFFNQIDSSSAYRYEKNSIIMLDFQRRNNLVRGIWLRISYVRCRCVFQLDIFPFLDVPFFQIRRRCFQKFFFSLTVFTISPQTGCTRNRFGNLSRLPAARYYVRRQSTMIDRVFALRNRSV